MFVSSLSWTHRSPHYPALITSILELSRKYGIDRMRDKIVKHLETDWPQTLQDWDEQERDIESMLNHSKLEHVDEYFPEPASAIKLAQQFDIPSILPAAFYHISRLSILDDWDMTHADSSILPENRARRTAKWELLSGKDLRCILLGKAEFAGFLRGCINMAELESLRHRSMEDYDDYDPYLVLDCHAAERLWEGICDMYSQSADPLALLKAKGPGWRG